MKRLLVLCAILFAGVCTNLLADNLDSLNQFTGWEYSGDIRTQKLKTAGYTYSQLMDNGEELFTADTDGFIRIWNLETGKIRYSKKIEYSQIIANYQDSVVYYQNQTFLVGYDIQKDSIKFAMNLNETSVQLYFHHSNIILISTERREYNGPLTKVFPVTYLFDCEKIEFTSSNKIGLYNGSEFAFGLKMDNYVYSTHYYEGTFGKYSYKNTYIVKNGVLYDSLDDMKYCISFDRNDDYCLFGKDSTFICFDMNNKNKTVTRTMPFVFRNFVLDRHNRLVQSNDNGSKLIISGWKFTINMKEIILPISAGSNSIVVMNNDSSIAIVAGMSGRISLVALSDPLPLKAEFSASNTEIEVGRQIYFNNQSSVNADKFKWILGDGSESDMVDLTHIFKKAGDFDVILIASDGSVSDTVIYKDMIHVIPKIKPKLSSYTEDRRFGYLPLTVNFKNITNKPYTFLEWDFGDSTTSKEENPTHTFYKLGKYDVKLTIISNGDTLRMTKAFNVINEKLQLLAFIEGTRYSDSYATYGYSYRIDNIIDFGSSTFYYTYYNFEDVSHHYYYHSTESKTLIGVDNYHVNFTLDANNLTFRRYLDCGVLASNGIVYNKKGEVLFQTSNVIPGTIMQDCTRDSLFSCDYQMLYYWDQYFTLLWQSEYSKLVNDSCTLLNVSSLDNGNIVVFIYAKSSQQVQQFVINPETGKLVAKHILPDLFNRRITRLHDDLYFSTVDSVLFTFDFKGNIKNKTTIGVSEDYPSVSMYGGVNCICPLKLDSSLIAVVYLNKYPHQVLKIYDSELNFKVEQELPYDKVHASTFELYPFMLDDKSVTVVENMYNTTYSYQISRWFFPELYKSDSSTSVPEPTPGESLTEIFPNPAHNEITISANEDIEFDKIEITDINGNIYQSAINQRVGNNVVLDISKLSVGTYYYRIISNGKQLKGRFVKE